MVITRMICIQYYLFFLSLIQFVIQTNDNADKSHVRYLLEKLLTVPSWRKFGVWYNLINNDRLEIYLLGSVLASDVYSWVVHILKRFRGNSWGLYSFL